MLATEQDMRAEVTLPDGQSVVLTGYADRLEVEDDGRVVVVDLKTGKVPTHRQVARREPPARALPARRQPRRGRRLDRCARVGGGAELWQLRKEKAGKLKVQEQEPQTADDDGRLPVELQLMQAATALRDEEFPAHPSSLCERCEFVPFCPAHVSGSVLS